jgi:tetratricopeptide (TPR) repeat protein
VKTVSCPGCRSYYQVDERTPPTAPFRCRACGATSTLGDMLLASSGSGRLAAVAPAPPPPAAPQPEPGGFVLPGPPVEFVLPGPPVGFVLPGPPVEPTPPPPQVQKKTSQRVVVVQPVHEPDPAPAPPPQVQKRTSARVAALDLDLAPEPTPPPQVQKKTSARAPAQAAPLALDLEPEPEPEPPPPVEEDVVDDDEAPPPKARANLAVPAPVVAGVLALVVLGVLGVVLTRGEPKRPPRPPTQATADEPPPPAATEPPAPTTPAAADPQKIIDEAQALVAAEDYAGALARLRDLPAAERKRVGRTLVDAERQWTDLAKFQTDALAVLDEVAALRGANKLGPAYQKLDAFLAARKREVPDTPTGRRLLAQAAELITACNEAGVDPTLPVRDPPPERAQAQEALARDGRARIDALRAALAAEKAAAATVHEAEVDRARAATSERPVTLELVPGFTLSNARIEAFDDQGFTLRSADGDDVRWAWDAVRLETALKIRRAGVRTDVADDQLRLGTWCLKRRLFREARRAFKQAVTIEAGLAPRVPDLDALERASAVFQGDLERRGTSISLGYDFAREDAAADFASATGAQAAVREGRLEVHGRGMALLQLELGFNGLADVSATLGPTSGDQAAGVVGLSFAAGTEREETWVVVVFPRSGDLLLARWRAGGEIQVVDQKPGAVKGASPKVRLVVRRDRVEVIARGRTQASQPITPMWEKCRVLVGCNAQGQGAASFEDLTVRGRVRTDWLRKSFGEFDALLGAVLAMVDELPSLARPKGDPLPTPPLSAEDAWGLEGVDPVVLRDYRQAVATASGAAEGDWPTLLKALEAFNGVLERSRGFAAAYLWRARLCVEVGLPGVALLDLSRARALCPGFHEALALEAACLAQLGRLDEAAARAEEAIALRPDGADGWGARGAIKFLREDLAGAQDDLELALALEPRDEALRGLVRNVRHVLQGPPWSRRFRAETKHYIVETNIAQKRVDDYARDLEAVRAVYAQRFGAGEGTPAAGKSKVLIFDTEEGYHSYAALAIDDRVESTLGCYLPRYRQLLLFEDKDDASQQETRQVLFHEGFHQFLHQLVPDNLVPYWLNEGLAEYLSACTVTNGDVSAEGQVLNGRLQDLRWFLRSGGPFPLDRLMKESPAEFYSGAVWAKYAQAWSMVHFFEQGPDEDLRGRFRAYVAKLREGVSAEDAFTQAWGGVDWGAAQRAWRKHVDGLTPR